MAEWRKSSRSTAQGGDCVELAALDGAIGVRDSKNIDGGNLSLSPERFRALIHRIKVDGITA